ncbi:SMP-30/gluconolactonase/LRE family protein [Exilibacterium tricleocarpae]|uniref:SMP-30/gluconolactonase/LRE family protein n=1 Tax=Exilibacterium tricleocarpae TaxID=2591008 RepID=A0A545T0M3_9GAMM|nr:SMP-30/gluconolactonase/LRE family protein [Exilibacterium tricleocarpae]TQV70750.1 SMP-30/gluconolactonase/LRE family protein [Exilibacterium tricleocarpae]
MKTVTPDISKAVEIDATIGESPVWSAKHKRLLWIDITGRKLHAYDPAAGRNETLDLPEVVGALAEDPSGALTLGLGCDLARLMPEGKAEAFARAPHAGPSFRFNDGKYDRKGRLFTGLMNTVRRKESGILYRYDPDGAWHVCDEGFDLPNGLEWSRDGLTFYFTDSHKGEIYAYDFDPESGELSHRRLFFSIDPAVGKPDGLTIDADGFLLSVLFDGYAILRIDPDGKVERRIRLPVPRPTSSAFSEDRRHLFVTTARIGLSAADLGAAPASGALLQLDYEGALK